jgi:4-amino-4-deoxy-L-arabinose transferase-like glycosyltransferase
MLRRSALRRDYVILTVVTVLPRLAVLVYERGGITSANVDKGAIFARTFIASGTYGFIPRVPSAYTQPLYGFFLVPVYWIFGRGWAAVGLAQILVCVATTFVVFRVAARFVSRRASLLAAAATTLQPYLIWHDVHMNREVLDQLLAALAILLVLVAAETRQVEAYWLLGAVCGLVVLGNVRLAALPLILLTWLLARRRLAVGAAVALIAATALTIAPWIVRTQHSVGCWTITTDSRALWKANNPATYDLLSHGQWIDNVPDIPGSDPSPQDAGRLYQYTGFYQPTNECAQMRFYRTRATTWIERHPAEKARLAALGASWLWQPSVTKTEDRPGSGGWVDRARTWIEPVWVVPMYLLAAAGLLLVPRGFAALVVAILGYNTLLAALFAGETRYRVPWDFLLVVLAARAAVELVARVAALRSTAVSQREPRSL